MRFRAVIREHFLRNAFFWIRGTDRTQCRTRVAVVYRYVPQYRDPFYSALRAALSARGIDFQLIYGQPIGEDRYKSDAIELPWGQRIRNYAFPLGRKNVCYQPILWR